MALAPIGVAAIVGAVAVVPTVDIDGPPPVTGDIGVPEVDELRLPEGAALAERPEPLPVTCLRDGEPFDCVQWVEPLLPPETGDGPAGFVRVMGDMLVVVDGHSIGGVDLATGARVWRFGGLGVDANLAHDDGLLAVRSVTGTLSVLDVTDGTRIWTVETAGTVFGDVVTPTAVYTGGEEDAPPAIVARDRTDGDELWRWPLPWNAAGAFVRTVGPQRLLVSGGAGTALLDTGTGRPAWQRQEQFGFPLIHTSDTLLWHAFIDRRDERGVPATAPRVRLTATDLGDGSRRWTRAVGDQGSWQPAVAGDLVIVGTADHLTAIAIDDGSVRWRVPTQARELAAWWATDRPPATGTSIPVVTLSAVGRLRARSPVTGQVRWTATPDVVNGPRSPVVTGGRVFVRSFAGTQAFDLATGRELVTVRTPNWFSISADARLWLHRPSGSVARVELGVDGASTR